MRIIKLHQFFSHLQKNNALCKQQAQTLKLSRKEKFAFTKNLNHSNYNEGN